jgi:amino acid adenylation domain-containing protein
MSSTLEQILPPEVKPQLTTASEAKLILLEKYLRGDAVQNLSTRYEIPRAADQKAQLSFAQERMWFLDQLMPGSPVFNVPMAVRLTHPINVDALQLSVNEIVRRHETLRTSFVTIDGEPSPVVSPEAETKLHVIDLTDRDIASAELESRTLLEKESRRPFDLSRGPLIRTTLIRPNDRSSIFLVVKHHIVSDGWSLLVFFQQLAALYECFANGGSPELTDLPIQYGDYAAWHKDWLRDEVIEQQLGYWKNQLGGELPILDLPTDFTRPAMQTYAGAREVGAVSPEVTQSLLSLSQQQGATLFMTVLAAFNVLLHRLSGQEDIIVGSPIANRPRTETENLIGLFLNNLALRTDLSGNPTFSDLLSHTRQTSLDAYANQDVPFEKLIEALKPERDLSRTSIFQVYFNLFSFSERIHMPGGETANFVDAWLQSDETLSKFDLTLYAGIDNDQLKLAFVYNTDLFAAGRVQEMMRQFANLLTQIATDPAQNINDYSLVTAYAENLLPDPTLRLAAHKAEPITTLISQQAKRRPNETAVIDAVRNWTYREIDLRSNQIANFLLEKGIRKGDVVAIYAHRSASLVSAILGAMKAGAAFTILDPAYPASRMIDCLRIADPRGFIQLKAAGALPEALGEFLDSLESCVRLYVSANADDDSYSRASTEPPSIGIDPDDLAYIAFTSGSTGVPKGVMGKHGPLSLFTAWAVERFGLDESDRFCMLSGLAHDPLHRDIFTPLQLGGTLCVPDPSHLEDSARLRGWMRAQQITIANLTPAMAQLLCEQSGFDAVRLDSLRCSFLVGDVLRQRDVDQMKQLAPSLTCVNLYGATETQRAVGHYVAGDGNKSAKQVLPLGAGIKDVQLLVLNQKMQRCGVGEVGEIYFRSPHVARGYLGDVTLTSERFITNPFTKRQDDPVYRTGDLGRYLPDGNVEHAGRADRQIKIRGFRIEPAEIEAALIRSGHAREAVVVLSEKSGQKNLIAYLVPTHDLLSTTDELREYLSTRLPAYMIPRAFVILAALPLTPNGKLDRRALPGPSVTEPTRDVQSARPQTAAQETLITIWKSVLDLSEVGIHDNFFELGGHSLIAVRLFAQIEKQFDKRLPLATLFRAPTVAQLAAALENESVAEQSSLVPIQTSGSQPPFFCVHAVGGNVLEYYELARHLGDDQPFYGLQSRALTGGPAHTTIEEMAAHYINEMRGVQPAGPYFLGGRSLGGIIAYEMARQLRAAGGDIALLAVLDSYPIGHDRSPVNGVPQSSSMQRLARRVNAHFSNIRSLPGRQKVSYIFAKSKFGPVQVRSTIWRTIYGAYKNLGLNLPQALRDVEEFNWLAAQKYCPQPFDGRVTFFWASKDLRAKFDMVEGWQRLARGGVDLHEIAGTHLDMIKEPHVSDLADKLKSCLTDRRSNHDAASG